MQLTRFLGCGY